LLLFAAFGWQLTASLAERRFARAAVLQVRFSLRLSQQREMASITSRTQ
jgi:hypothetical protein